MARMQAKRKRSRTRLLFSWLFHGSFMRLWCQSRLTGSRLFVTPAEDEARTALRHQAVATIAEEINRTTGLNSLQLARTLRAVCNQGKAVSTGGTAALPVARVYPFLITVWTLEHECHRLLSSAVPHHFFTCFIRRRRLRIWLWVSWFFLPSNGFSPSWNSIWIGVPMIFNDLR